MECFDIVWEFLNLRCGVCMQVGRLSLSWNKFHCAMQKKMQNKMGTYNINVWGKLLHSQDEINLPGKPMNFIGTWSHLIVVYLCMHVFVY